jgi:hypothetical protein
VGVAIDCVQSSLQTSFTNLDCSDQDRRSQQLITMTTGVHRFDEAESSQAIQANQRAQSPTLIVAKDGPI